MSRKFLFTPVDHFKNFEILNQTRITGGFDDGGHVGEEDEDIDEGEW